MHIPAKFKGKIVQETAKGQINIMSPTLPTCENLTNGESKTNSNTDGKMLYQPIHTPTRYGNKEARLNLLGKNLQLNSTEGFVAPGVQSHKDIVPPNRSNNKDAKDNSDTKDSKQTNENIKKIINEHN